MKTVIRHRNNGKTLYVYAVLLPLSIGDKVVYQGTCYDVTAKIAHIDMNELQIVVVESES